jgi:hypothetical protein
MHPTTTMLRFSLAALVIALAAPALADSAEALCTITPKGETVEPDKRECVFSQRQGYVDIRFAGEDTFFLELSPLEGAGNFSDINGKPAYRKKGLGSDGVVFDTDIGIVRVYWGR